MALTTFDHAIAGASAPVYVQKSILSGDVEANGMPHSLAYSAGIPGAATVPSSGLAGEALTSWTGQIPITAAGRIMAVSGGMSATNPSDIIIADRLWQNSGIVATTTTAQSLGTPVAIPARDADGTTAGRGVLAAIEITTTGNTASAVTSTTISYTSSDGTAGRTGTLPLPFGMPGTPIKGTFAIFSLQAGDVGVRSIESITLGTSYGTGALSLVLFRPLIVHSELTASRGFHLDCLTGAGVQMYENSCLWIIRKYSGSASILRLLIHHTAGA